MDLLAEGRDLYDACAQGGVAPECDAVSSAAAAFLQALGYVTPANGAAGGALIATDPELIANRSALLAFAARLDRVFRLRSAYATGLYFFGAQHRHHGATINAGGRGTSLRAAFESCIGEAAERSAVRAPHATARAWRYGFGSAPACTAPPASGGAGSATNGCAAGPDLATAQLAALLELIERDALMLWWYGGRRGVALRLDPADALALERFVAGLRLSGGRHAWLLDLTSDLGVPVVAALSCLADGSEVLVGSAADTDPLAAARSATLEMCQMHLARELAAGSDGRPADTEAPLRLDGFPAFEPAAGTRPCRRDFPTAGSAAEQVARLAEHLSSLALPAVWQDLTDEDVGIPAVRVVVGGLQSPQIASPTRRLLTNSRLHGVSQQDWQRLPAII